MIERYEDFEIRVGTGRDGVYPVEVDSPAGEASYTFHLPFDAQELDRIMERVQAFDTDQDFLKAIGGRLYAALFVGPLKTLLAESLGMCGEEKGLRLRLRIGPPELAALPWEFLYDAEKNKFLALLPQTVLTRHIAVPEPMRSLKAQQIRVLVAVASPKRLPSLDMDKEKRRLLEALEPLIDQNLAQVEFLEGATMSRLMDKLREKFNVLHFIGHGDLDEETGQGYLCFEDEWGGTNLIDGQTLGHLLENTSVRLVTLNACESARLTDRETRLSMAPALLAAGVPAVVAMQTEIPDETAVIFAREFYRSLAFNRPVGAALTEARNVIQCTLGMDNVDWAIPVLYDRSIDGHILDLERPKTWREVWLTLPRLITLAVGLVAFVTLLFSSISGVRELLPSPEPTATPLVINPAEEDEILVVVTKFNGENSSKKYNASQRIFEGLQLNLQELAMEKLRVEQIGKVVTDSEAAWGLGEVYSATIVIWGYYDDAGMTPHYELVQDTGEMQQLDLGKYIALSSQPARFNLYVARDLPRAMTGLSSFTIGQIYYSQQKWEDALRFASLAVEIIPEVVENMPDVEASGIENPYLLRGNIYSWLRDYEKSIADFTLAVATNRDCADAYVGRGGAYINLGQYEAAQADLEKAIGLDASIALAHYNRGLMNTFLARFDEALTDLNRAIELDPTHANAYWLRGYTYYDLGDTAHAMDDMEYLVSLTPDSPVGYVARGGLYVLAEEYDKAEADLKRALEIDPDSLGANTNLGSLYFRQQKFVEAVEFNEKAIALSPNRPEPRFSLAICRLALGQTERALTENRQAIADNPYPVVAEDAIRELEWLRQVQPDTPGLDQMIEEIRASLEELE
jgi:tetratricopeptide (TPR) repeat protein